MAEDCAPTELMICTTCKMGQAIEDDDQRPGARLMRTVADMDLPEGVTLTPVKCLSNCSEGCSIVLRGGPRRWTYVYGRLDEGFAEIIVDGVTRYHNAADGLVPWRERPEHFRKNCIARIPPLEP